MSRRLVLHLRNQVGRIDFWSFGLNGKTPLSTSNFQQIIIFFNLRVNLTPKVFICSLFIILSYYVIIVFSHYELSALWVKQPDNPRVCINTEFVTIIELWYNSKCIVFRQSFNLTCVQPRKQTILSPCRVVM